MNFWQIDGGNVQEGSSFSTYILLILAQVPILLQLKRSSCCPKDVKYELLKYQLDIAIERNHAMKISKINAKMLNAVASQVLQNDELNQMTHLTLGE